jgi:hypothetical protein
MKQARILTAAEFKRLLAVIDAHKHSERNRAIFPVMTPWFLHTYAANCAGT